jgi:murein DD-endopeptidase MepM/ murein hydrolase activator NlpD
MPQLAASSVDFERPEPCASSTCGVMPPPRLVYPISKRFQSHVIRLPRPAGIHSTAGLPGYPGLDFAAEFPATVVAVEAGRVRRFSGHDPSSGPPAGIHGPFGWSLYLRGDSGADYYYTHLASRSVAEGQRVRAGQTMGRVGDYSRWGGLDHIHLGANGGRTTQNKGEDYERGVALILRIGRAPRV